MAKYFPAAILPVTVIIFTDLIPNSDFYRNNSRKFIPTVELGGEGWGFPKLFGHKQKKDFTGQTFHYRFDYDYRSK